jgi:hypothetical protein
MEMMKVSTLMIFGKSFMCRMPCFVVISPGGSAGTLPVGQKEVGLFRFTLHTHYRA